MDRIKADTITTALHEAQEDGLCAICGEPPATTPLALVPLCRWHYAALDLLLGPGFDP
jgi:hypothetical protein